MWKIGVTGGIGCGKSYVCHRLREMFGFPVYDCDSRAKQLMQQDNTLRTELSGLLGAEAYLPSGELNKPIIARLIFQNPDLLARVNSAVHPRVKADFLMWAERQDSRAVILESAILHSSRLNDAVDVVVRVTAPKEVRMKRILSRDHCTPQQAMDRIRNQRNEDGLAHFVLNNDGAHPVDALLSEFIKTIEKNKQ